MQAPQILIQTDAWDLTEVLFFKHSYSYFSQPRTPVVFFSIDNFNRCEQLANRILLKERESSNIFLAKENPVQENIGSVTMYSSTLEDSMHEKKLLFTLYWKILQWNVSHYPPDNNLVISQGHLTENKLQLHLSLLQRELFVEFIGDNSLRIYCPCSNSGEKSLYNSEGKPTTHD